MSGAFQAPAAAVGSSPRVGLARLALQAALAVPDVVAGDAGPHGLRVTADPSGGFLVGVSVTAERDGRYGVDLRLVARLAPLVPLGETVRRRVHESARRLDLADRLGTVNVEFASVIDPFEVDLTPPTTAAPAAPAGGGPAGAVAPSTAPPPAATPPSATPPTATPPPSTATPPPAAPPTVIPQATEPLPSLRPLVDPAVSDVAPPPSPALPRPAEPGEEGLG